MDKEKTLKYLYRLISDRDYLEQTLRNKLHKKNVKKEIIEESISRLKELGYINDKDYIRSFILFKIKKWEGPNRIKNKLFMLGADSDIVDNILNELYTYGVRKKNIENLMLKKSSKLTREKLIAYCSRRGFSLSEILIVENEILKY